MNPELFYMILMVYKFAYKCIISISQSYYKYISNMLLMYFCAVCALIKQRLYISGRSEY